MNTVIVFWHQPAESTDVPKSVEDYEESEADPGEEEHAHTLPRTQTNVSKCMISLFWTHKDQNLSLYCGGLVSVTEWTGNIPQGEKNL